MGNIWSVWERILDCKICRDWEEEEGRDWQTDANTFP